MCTANERAKEASSQRCDTNECGPRFRKKKKKKKKKKRAGSVLVDREREASSVEPFTRMDGAKSAPPTPLQPIACSGRVSSSNYCAVNRAQERKRERKRDKIDNNNDLPLAKREQKFEASERERKKNVPMLASRAHNTHNSLCARPSSLSFNVCVQ